MSEQSQSGMIIYQTEDGLTKIDVAFENDTVWLSLEQMAELFQRDRTVIGRHIKNVFSEGELQKNSVCAKFAHTAADGKTYQVDYYNLDMIISVGYRVKSQRGVQFRIWASGVIKESGVCTYSVNALIHSIFARSINRTGNNIYGHHKDGFHARHAVPQNAVAG
jgi:hypothetical protein